MQLYRDMYVSPEIEHPGSVKRRLLLNAGSLSLYVITLCEDGSGQLQLFPSSYLKVPYLRQHCPMIVGIAKERSGAIALVERMFRECYEKTGEARIVPYLAKRDVRLQGKIQGEQQ